MIHPVSTKAFATEEWRPAVRAKGIGTVYDTSINYQGFCYRGVEPRGVFKMVLVLYMMHPLITEGFAPEEWSPAVRAKGIGTLHDASINY